MLLLTFFPRSFNVIELRKVLWLWFIYLNAFYVRLHFVPQEAEELEKIRRKLAQPRRKQPRQNSMSNDAKGDSNAIDPPAMIRAANMRYARLAISALRPKEKDAFFQDLADELDQDELCYKGQRIGAERMLPQGPSTKKNMVNQASQIWPGEFFDFDKEVVPVIERLVGRICYQVPKIETKHINVSKFIESF